MVLNLSNHNSSTFLKKQKEEVIRLYCKIEDMAFPSIQPLASLEEVQLMAEEYLQKILGFKDLKAVHLMGEMTFVYQLVKLLEKHQIPVIASTTTRNVVEHGDGSKTWKFDFHQFRPYY